MTIKQLSLITLATTSLCWNNAYALFNLGQVGKVDLVLTSSLAYDSNIRGRALADDGWLARESIRFQYVRPSRKMDISATLGVQATQYFDDSDLNRENIIFDLSLSPGAEMRNSRFIVSADLILDTRTDAEPDVGEIVTTRKYGAAAEIIYTPTRRYGMTANGSFTRIDPDQGYSERNSLRTGLSIFRQVSQALQFVGGLNFNRMENLDDGDLDTEVYEYFVGAKGDIFPKVSGSINAGAATRSSGAFDGKSIPFVSAALVWAVDESSQVTLSAGNSFGTGLAGGSQQQTSASLAASRSLSERIRVRTGINYAEITYENTISTNLPERMDTEKGISASITYQLNRWGSVALSASYTDRESNNAFSDYDRYTTSLQFNGRW